MELTESALAKNEAILRDPMTGLKDRGIRVYLDDFGTGYSSLGRLSHLPVDTIKIDRTFVRRIDRGEQTIVEAVIHMAHALNKEVVAEGVETEFQAAVLKSLGCDYFQGFLFSRPLPEAEVAALLKTHQPWGTPAHPQGLF